MYVLTDKAGWWRSIEVRQIRASPQAMTPPIPGRLTHARSHCYRRPAQRRQVDLFNRLTGRRAALVSETPGLTRDRRTGEAMIAGTSRDPRRYGWARGSSTAPPSPARMRAQSELALARADLVLFVFDARDGIIPADAVFARAGRASGRAGYSGCQQVRRPRGHAGVLRGVPAGARRADRHFGRARRGNGGIERRDRRRAGPATSRQPGGGWRFAAANTARCASPSSGAQTPANRPWSMPCSAKSACSPALSPA